MVVHILDRREDQLRLLVVNGEGDLLEGFLFARVEGKVFREILVGNDLKAEVGHGHLDVSQFQRQQVHVPRGQFADLVVRKTEGFDLRIAQFVGDDAGHFFQAERLRCPVSGMPGHNFMVGINDQRHEKAEFPDAGGDALNRLVVFARVARVGMDVRQGNVLNVHVNLRALR